MNKYQEALDKIKEMLIIFGRPTCLNITDILQELVDKQTPKKAYWNHAYYCDACNMEVKKYDNYCSNCGVRLEWR